MEETKQLAEIYTMVERGEMSPKDFFLAFKTRFASEISNARDRWKEKNPLWKTLDWKKVEESPLLSQLIGDKYRA